MTQQDGQINLKRIMANQCTTLNDCSDIEQLKNLVTALFVQERSRHLEAVDSLERALGITPRTSELRGDVKQTIRKEVRKALVQARKKAY